MTASWVGRRFSLRLGLWLATSRPLLLSSTVKEDNDILAVDLTNPDIARDGTVVLPRGTLHVLRSKFVWDGNCYEGMRAVTLSDPVLLPIGLPPCEVQEHEAAADLTRRPAGGHGARGRRGDRAEGKPCHGHRCQ